MIKDYSDIERWNPPTVPGYFFLLAARVILHASSHRQDSRYHGLCYTSRGAMTGTTNSLMSPLWGGDPITHRTMSGCCITKLHGRRILTDLQEFSKIDWFNTSLFYHVRRFNRNCAGNFLWTLLAILIFKFWNSFKSIGNVVFIYLFIYF